MDNKYRQGHPRDVPMIMFGGSPHIVADPPRFAQKISDKIIGTGSNFIVCASSSVTVARNSTTVMLSMNIDKNAESDIKQMSSGTVR